MLKKGMKIPKGVIRKGINRRRTDNNQKIRDKTEKKDPHDIPQKTKH